jgi:hypothetical protein
MKKQWFASIGVIIFSGCSSVVPPTVTYQADVKYRPVAVVVNDGRIESHYTQAGYVALNIVDQTSMIVKEELQKMGVFSAVELNNPYQEVVLSVSFSRKVLDENLAKSVFQGGTLFLVPTTNKFKTHVRLDVRVRAEILRSYEYDLDSTQRVFLADDPYAERRGVIQAFWSRFLADAQKDKLFENLVPLSLERQKK